MSRGASSSYAFTGRPEHHNESHYGMDKLLIKASVSRDIERDPLGGHDLLVEDMRTLPTRFLPRKIESRQLRA